MRRWLAFLLLPLILSAVRWRVAETENFRVVYPEGFKEQARHSASVLETYREEANRLTGWDPGRVWVVLEDVGMGINGYANPVGRDIHLFTTPRAISADWLRHVGVHEYVHIASIQPVYGVPRFFNILWGPWVLPNAAVPGWMIEGVTVYAESQLEPFEGRLNDGFFDANLLTRAAQDSFPRRWEMDGSITRFPLGNSIYAYGGPFFGWLAREKGEETVAEFYRKNADNIPAFFIDVAARKSFGDGFLYLLHDWRQSVDERAQAFVPADSFVAVDSAARRLTDKGWYLSDLATDGERVYYSRTTVNKRAALSTTWYEDVMALDPETGEAEVLFRPNRFIKRVKVEDGVLYYLTNSVKRGFANRDMSGFGDVFQLRSRDLTSGRDKKLYQGRVRSFDLLPDGGFLVSEDRTPEVGSNLYRLGYTGEIEDLLYSGDLLVSEIAVSPDGVIYASARSRSRHLDIYSFADGQWINLTRSPYSEFDLEIDPQGNLLYSANPHGTEGRVGVYSLNPETCELRQYHTPSYAVQPVVMENELVFVGLNPAGFDVYSAAAQVSPALIPLEENTMPMVDPADLPTSPAYSGEFTKRSRLRPYLSLLRPWARIPYMLPRFDSTWNLTNLNAGIFLVGADVLGENSYQTNVHYDIITNTHAVGLNWTNQRFAPLILNLDYSHKPIFSLDHTLVGYDYSVNPSFSYPLVYRTGRGLNVIRWWEGLIWSRTNLQRVSIMSGLTASFSWPFFSSGFASTHQWLKPLNNTEEERSILYARCAGILDVGGGILVSNFNTIMELRDWGADDYGLYKYIRGYDAIEKRHRFIGFATLEYRHRLFKMRFGIWNPNVFFEDLYGHVFVDAAFDSYNLLGASAGIELSPEIHLFWGYVRIAPEVGISLNREGEIHPHFDLNTSIPFEIRRSCQDGPEFVQDPRISVPEPEVGFFP